jgi:Fur family ferric uptake transcriptional regulator
MDPGQPPPLSDPGDVLRERGLRVTPQRRAILGAFAGTRTEHLSADEVHARASLAVPELGRGTVYTTLAELTELGLLAAFGSPDAVRYETNATPHQHFRCRVCLRLYNIELGELPLRGLADQGFDVEQVAVTAEGVCADCGDYRSGLSAGVSSSAIADGAPVALPAGTAMERIETPAGSVLLAASERGLVCLLFEEHPAVAAVRSTMGRRRGSAEAHAHLTTARTFVAAYFSGAFASVGPEIDWEHVPSISIATLQATQAIPFGDARSYDLLRTDATARERGLALGANPLAIVVPCHRVTRGVEVTDRYVAGLPIKQLLLAHERARPQ